jgi:O-methyltransferase
MSLKGAARGLLVSLVQRAVQSRDNHRYDDVIRLAYQFLKSNQVDGDYLEFGSYRGRTFTSAWRAISRAERPDHLYCFDSFEGLPAIDAVDKGTVFVEGKYAMSLEDFQAIARKANCPPSRYTPVKGFYSESLTPELYDKLAPPLRKAALIYVDCDLYTSTRDALEFCYPCLQTGTVLCFDDFFTFSGDRKKGEQLALAEFLERHPDISVVDYHLYGWHGKSFIINRD